jgi:hypothetical protein
MSLASIAIMATVLVSAGACAARGGAWRSVAALIYLIVIAVSIVLCVAAEVAVY